MSLNFYPIKLYIRRVSIASSAGSALLINGAMWLWLLFQIPYREEQVFLHYNVLFGVDYSGSGWKIFVLPLLGFCIIIINLVAGWSLFNHDKFISQLLNIISLFCQIFLGISTALLVLLNV